MLPKEPADQEAMYHQWLTQQVESIDETLRMLVSNMWGIQGKELVGDSEMRSEVKSFVNVFRLADILAGPSGVHIRASVAEVMPVVKERMQKLCRTAA